MKNKQLAAIVIGTLFAAVTQLAIAKGPNYTYAEIGYINLDGDNVEGNGGGVNISYGATDHIFVKMGYAHFNLDTPDADADRFQIGLGGHMEVAKDIDVLGALSYVDIEFSNGVPVSGDDGYLAEIGVRGMVNKKFELNATVSQLDVGGGSDTGFGIGAVGKIAKKFWLTGGYRQFQDDDEGELFLGVRLKL
ncbi:MAG: hypothetical protein OEU91_11275 [Gammaproteobacteria bacterium]|nr:hypothetical protein [Gammaproteobacteria bacterium]